MAKPSAALNLPRLRSAWDPSEDPGISFLDDPTMTHQSFQEECDINNIIKNLSSLGVTPGHEKQPLYGDFSTAPDYHAALNLIHAADAQFNALNATVRSRFGNDPAQFLAFASDPKNKDELIKLDEPLRRELDPRRQPAPAPAPAPSAEPAKGAS